MWMALLPLPGCTFLESEDYHDLRRFITKNWHFNKTREILSYAKADFTTYMSSQFSRLSPKASQLDPKQCDSLYQGLSHIMTEADEIPRHKCVMRPNGQVRAHLTEFMTKLTDSDLKYFIQLDVRDQIRKLPRQRSCRAFTLWHSLTNRLSKYVRRSIYGGPLGNNGLNELCDHVPELEANRSRTRDKIVRMQDRHIGTTLWNLLAKKIQFKKNIGRKKWFWHTQKVVLTDGQVSASSKSSLPFSQLRSRSYMRFWLRQTREPSSRWVNRAESWRLLATSLTTPATQENITLSETLACPNPVRTVVDSMKAVGKLCNANEGAISPNLGMLYSMGRNENWIPDSHIDSQWESTFCKHLNDNMRHAQPNRSYVYRTGQGGHGRKHITGSRKKRNFKIRMKRTVVKQQCGIQLTQSDNNLLLSRQHAFRRQLQQQLQNAIRRQQRSKRCSARTKALMLSRRKHGDILREIHSHCED